MMKESQSVLEEILRYIVSICRIGERAAGTPEELEAAKLIEGEFKEIGLQNVRLEAFPVICRKYKDCQLTMLEPSAKNIPCVSGGTSLSTSHQGISAELIDGGFGTARDYEALSRGGVDLAGKVVLIERSDRLTWWPDVSCALAASFGIAAVVFASNFSEHTAFRKDAFPFAAVPVVSVPYREAQQLRDTLAKHRVKVILRNIVETEENGVSYNAIGDIVGRKYPDAIVAVTAHHDSWFEGANDDAYGVALMLETAKLLKENHAPKRTIRFISFGAEESGSHDFFEWAVGSFHYASKQEIKNTVANVNLDVPGYGDKVVLRGTPEMTTFVQEIVEELNLGSIISVLDTPTSSTDHWSFVMAGVPSLDFGFEKLGPYQKIYHTNYDTPLNVSYLLATQVFRALLGIVQNLGSAELLPYDFVPTVRRLKEQLTSKKAGLEEIVNTSKALKEVRQLAFLARRFNSLKSRRPSDPSDVEFVNRLQLETCSLLNKSMIGTGGRANKTVAWVMSEHFETLAKVEESLNALQTKDLSRAISALGSLRSMDWAINVAPKVYDRTFCLMLRQNRYPGIYINVMSEFLSLQRKARQESPDISSELLSIEEKRDRILRDVTKMTRTLQHTIEKSCRNLKRASSACR